MRLQEIYKTQIINNLKLFNVVLGLSSIGNPSIEEFLELGKKSYKQICKRKENKTKAVNVLMEICSDIMVISEDCCFYNVTILDFKAYDRPDFILDLVLKFSSKDRIVEFINKDYKTFIALMVLVEKEIGPNIKGSLSYIVMRNFLLLCELGMYRFAYYYACLIRTQIFVSEGLNPRVEYSDLFKNELSLAIKKEQNKYSKAIKRKIKSSVTGALNKIPLVNVGENEKRDSHFTGEVVNLTIGSDGSRSLEYLESSVKEIQDKHDEQNSYETKDLVKQLAKNTLETSKDVVVEGSKMVGGKIVDGAKSTVSAVSEPIKENSKEVLGSVKEKMDDVLGVSSNPNIDEFIEKVNSQEENEQEVHHVGHEHQESHIDESHLMDKDKEVDKYESYDGEDEGESDYDSFGNEDEPNKSEDEPNKSESQSFKRSSRLEKLNRVKSNQEESKGSPSKKSKLEKLNKSKTESSKPFGGSSVF